MKWKLVLFSIVAIVLFFGAVEGTLWLVGVETLLAERDPFQGFARAVRVYELDRSSGVYKTPARAVRHSFNYQEFRGEKPRNGIRLFTLGGSSAYGFPWGADVAFTSALGRALQSSFPDRKVEAVNAAAMSYGSHRLRILAQELLTYEPDLLILYEGHNEFVERRFYSDLLGRRVALDPLRQLLYRWRLYAIMTRLYERLSKPTHPSTPGEMLGLDVVREYSSEVDDREKQEVARQFADNYLAILDLAQARNVPVVLCTVPSNLSGWAPNQSFFTRDVPLEARRAVPALVAEGRSALDRGDPASAAAALEKARALAPGYAEVHFLLGRAYEALGRWSESKDAYIRARDADGKPARAVSAVNEWIRELARERQATLVDVERIFEEASPHGIVGFNLIEDYVHPKPEGHWRIALALWTAIVEKGLVAPPRPADRSFFETSVPLEGGRTAGSKAGPEALGTIGGEKTPSLLFNLAVVLENQGQGDLAIEKYRECLTLDPGHPNARYNLARLLHRKGHWAEAAEEHRKTLEIEPNHVRSLVGLGESLRKLGRLPEAREAFLKATERDAGLSIAWDGLGGTEAQLGRYPAAENAFRRALGLDPGNPDVRANLGFALFFQKKLPEAERLFAAVVEEQPDHLKARNGLGAVFLESGRLEEAERAFGEALALAPGDAFSRNGLAEVARRRGRAPAGN